MPRSSLGALSVGGADDEPSVGGGQDDEDEPGMDELAQAGRDEVEHARDVDLGHERARNLVERLELLQPAGRRFVETRVLDRDRGLGGEQLHELLVLGGERGAALLLGQVQVSVGDPAQQDRDTEERPHRRVVRREADRARVVGEVVEPQRLRVVDQRAENPAAVRRVADRRLGLLVDAR